MAYTKTVWQDGDVITAQKMNNIENGIESTAGGSVLIVDVAITTPVANVEHLEMNKTWKEIHDAFIAGTVVIAREIRNTSTSLEIVAYMGTDVVNDTTYYYVAYDSSYGFMAMSENEYPYYDRT